MATTQQSQSEEGSLIRDLLYALRYYLGSRRGLLIMAAVALVGGLAFNWSWLVAAGIAPLLLTALPCVAMCALGLCMNRMTGGACAAKRAADPGSSDIELQSEHAEAPLPDMRPVAARRDTQIDG